MKISVIGTGYLGAVHAACMAEIGHQVIGVDTDAGKIATLAAGRTPFFEPGLAELLQSNISAGRLSFTTSMAEATAFADVHFICVGTPQQAGSYAADLRYVDEVVTQLALHLRRPALVVGKSTVPVGTATRLKALVAKLAHVDEGPVELAWNPEFLREGFAVQDTLRPDRLVFGVDSDASEATLREVYGPILDLGTTCITADFATAELVKVAANAFLATKISFINAMAEVCEAAGADVTVLSNALGHDARIGHRFLHAGLGFGGGCLPKDIRAFRARAGEIGAQEALTFLKEVDEINMRLRERTVDVAKALVGGSFLSRTVTVLGAAFKPDSDDVRDSPALHIAALMQLKGASVVVHDPEAMPNARRLFPTLRYAASLDEACADSDLVVLATEWPLYRDADPEHLAGLTRRPVMLDTRNVIDLAGWRGAGWQVRALGRPRA